MKRKLLATMLTLILVTIGLSACSDKSYENYLKAVEKTETVTKYSGDFNMKMSADINTDGLSDAELRNVSLYNNFEVINSYKSDQDEGLLESNIYINFGGLGFDIKYYDDSKKAFLKMPIIEKYVYMEDLSSLSSASDIESMYMNFDDISEIISDEAASELTKLWRDAVEANNVVRGKESLIETKEGEIKATKYIIKYEDKLFKELILDSMLILYRDDKFMESGLLNIPSPSKEMADIDIEKIKTEFIDLLVIENFELNSYIDIDGYIVKEELNFVIKTGLVDSNPLDKISINYSYKIYNIGKDQKIIIPSKEELEFMTSEELEIGLPSLFEDVFSR